MRRHRKGKRNAQRHSRNTTRSVPVQRGANTSSDVVVVVKNPKIAGEGWSYFDGYGMQRSHQDPATVGTRYKNESGQTLH